MSGSQSNSSAMHALRASLDDDAHTDASASPPPPGPPHDPNDTASTKIGRVPLWLFLFGGSAIIVALVASLALHLGFVTYLRHGVLPPVRSEGTYTLNPRLVRMFAEPEEEDEKPEEIPAAPEEEPDPIALKPEPKEEEVVEDPTLLDDPPPAPENEPVAQLNDGPGHGLEGLGGPGGGIALPSGGSGSGGSGIGGGDGPRVAVKPKEDAPSGGSRRARPSAIQLEDTSVAPQAISQVPALGYPKEFRDKGIEGRVVVQCIITERGQVRACRHKSGPKELGDYAMSIVREWQFEPGKDHAGRNVPVAYTFRFPFRLR